MTTSAFIETETCLMPQHVPGARAGTGYRRIQMVPASGTQGIVFTVDQDSRLRLWLNSEAGSTRWVCVDALFAGDIERVLDFSLEQNVSAGRLDGSLDLMVITRIGPDDAAAREHKWYVFNAVPASADAKAWRELFAAAVPQDTHGLLPESAHWGQAPRPYRSRLLRGRDAQGRQRLLWQRLDAQGTPLHDALEPPLPEPQPLTQLEVACTVDFEDQGVRREGYARHVAYEDVSHGKAGYMDLIWPEQDGQARSEHALTALNGSLKGWDAGAGLWPLTLPGSSSVTRLYFDSTRREQGVIAASRAAPQVAPLVSTLPGAPVPGSVRALRWPGDDDRILRFDLIAQAQGAPASLRLNESRDFSGVDNGRATLLSDSVAAFSACLCSVPHSTLQVLHVALAHEQGGIELLSQDSVSGLWQRATLADDDVMGAIHEVSTHTSTLRVLDETRAPLPGTPIRIWADVPCHAWVGGRSLHLSPLGPVVVQADELGQCRIAQVANGLGASQLRLEIGGAGRQALTELAINPMQPLRDRMRAIQSGEQLQQVRGFDGQHPFSAVPLARCISTSELLQQLLAAYDQTLNRAAHAPGAPRDDPFDRIGDMIGFLWSEDIDPGTYVIEQLADGGYQLALKIGNRLWTGLIELPQHAMALLDHALQRGLGVSLRDITNWLGQLFNWDEILATQNTLRQLLALMRTQTRDWMAHTAPAAIADKMDWARQTLTRLPDLDPQTRAWLERNMTDGPGAQPYSASDSGPASSWALSTLQDHAASATIGSGGQWDFATGIEAVMEGVGDQLAHVIEEIAQLLGNIDPRQQSMLGLIESLVAISSAEVIDVLGQTSIKLCSLVARCIDAMWDALDERLDIPVLTPLYEQIDPGSKASALNLVLLACAILGDVGSRAMAGKPLISPQMAQAIAQAKSLTDLLASPNGPEDEIQWATTLQMLASMAATAFRFVYYVAWMGERATPAGTPFEADIVRIKCVSNTVSWVIGMAWAVARCATKQPPSEALTGSVVAMLLQGTIARGRDAVELFYAQQGQAVPPNIEGAILACEVMVGGIVQPIVALYVVLESATDPREEPSDKTNWYFLMFMPLVQWLTTSIVNALAYPERNGPPSLRSTRNVCNGLRCAESLMSAIGLTVATANGWKVIGTTAD